MSDRLCNFCENKAIVEEAVKADLAVTHLPGMLGGVDVYVHPKDVNIYESTEDERKQYWMVWFMELPKECAC